MAVPEKVLVNASLPIADAAREEFEAAVRAHGTLVYRVAFSLLGHHHDAEDAVQETFLRFWKQRQRWREIADPRAWLARTAWRVSLSRRQARATTDSLEDAAGAVLRLRAEGAGADEIAATAQMRELLARLIAGLPAELRDVLVLSTVEELTSAEIAAALDIPEGSVRTRRMRARELLRHKLTAILEQPHER